MNKDQERAVKRKLHILEQRGFKMLPILAFTSLNVRHTPVPLSFNGLIMSHKRLKYNDFLGLPETL